MVVIVDKDGTENDLRKECENIGNKNIENYILLIFDLKLTAYIPDYVRVVLEYEYEFLKQSQLSFDEIKILILLKTIGAAYCNFDLECFFDIYINECPLLVTNDIHKILGDKIDFGRRKALMNSRP